MRRRASLGLVLILTVLVAFGAAPALAEASGAVRPPSAPMVRPGLPSHLGIGLGAGPSGAGSARAPGAASTGSVGRSSSRLSPTCRGTPSTPSSRRRTTASGTVRARGNDPKHLRAAVASSGDADVAAYANTYRGFN